jgi:hypothetical protein
MARINDLGWGVDLVLVAIAIWNVKAFVRRIKFSIGDENSRTTFCWCWSGKLSIPGAPLKIRHRHERWRLQRDAHIQLKINRSGAKFIELNRFFLYGYGPPFWMLVGLHWINCIQQTQSATRRTISGLQLCCHSNTCLVPIAICGIYPRGTIYPTFSQGGWYPQFAGELFVCEA